MDELHEKGKMIKCRKKDMHFLPWLESFVRSKRSLHPAIEIELDIKDNLSPDWLINTTEENLETIFENLFVNSIRAIDARRKKDSFVAGHISITVQKKNGKINVLFQDNGIPYKTVSGRGMLHVGSIMQELGGNMRKYHNPFRVYLTFPYGEGKKKEVLQ
jgi:nitrogen fixation/metabolism regulation signal transduction histidine kinase